MIVKFYFAESHKPFFVAREPFAFDPLTKVTYKLPRRTLALAHLTGQGADDCQFDYRISRSHQKLCFFVYMSFHSAD